MKPTCNPSHPSNNEKNFIVHCSLFIVHLLLMALAGCNNEIGENEETEPIEPLEPIEQIDEKGNVTQTGWTIPKVSDFEFTMTFVAQLSFDGIVSEDTGAELAAFCGEECRGKANLVFDKNFDAYICHLTIYSNVSSGETIRLKAFNPEKQFIYTQCADFPFKSNTGLGSPTYILLCKL